MSTSSPVNNPFFLPAKNPTTPRSTTTATTASPHSVSTSSPSKRPRAKRPKNYNDKSTITQTTEAVTQQNAFNSILDEADNLCQAAAEAQQLGRLQMASTYLLLLHARLVGLGKRFDKAYQGPQSSNVTSNNKKSSTSEQALPKQLDFGSLDVAIDEQKQSQTIEETKVSHYATIESTTAAITEVATTPSANDIDLPNAASLNMSHQGHIEDSSNSSSLLFSPPRSKNVRTEKNGDVPTELATPKTAAARQLASMLPQNIELDSAMMEHLAKAAAELHAARSHRKRPRPSLPQQQQQQQQQLFSSVQPSMPSDRVEWELPGVDRVRKPATAAMNTVPNANCNLKQLLQGDILEQRPGH